MIREVAIRRALAGVSFVDATTRVRVNEPLQVSSLDAIFLRNRSNVYVVTSARGLAPHLDAFTAPPAEPALGTVEVELAVADPQRRYLPRLARVALPRDPDPRRAGQADSLFHIVEIPLYPAPVAPLYPGWSVVRASVKREGSEEGLPWAWLRLRRASVASNVEPPLASGLCDARGEAMVAVSGIPVTNWDADDGGPVLSSEVDAVLEAYFDTTATSPPNPDLIDGKRDTLATRSVNVKLASGKQAAVRVEITLP